MIEITTHEDNEHFEDVLHQMNSRKNKDGGVRYVMKKSTHRLKMKKL